MVEAATATSAHVSAERLRRGLLAGGSFSLAATTIASAVAFFSNVLLARILLPSDFGLLSMGLLAFVLNPVIMNAHGQALVQSRTSVERTANTVLVLTSVIGFGLSVVLALASTLVAEFFGHEELGPVVVVLAVAFCIGAVGRVPVALLERRLDYARRSIPDVAAPVVQAVVSLGLALVSHGALGAWALVLGQLAYWVVWTASGWYLARWRPTWELDRQLAVEVLAFVRDNVGVGVVILLVRNLDKFAVAKFLGAQQLGLYAVAFSLSQLPSAIFSAGVARVLFPAFARVRDEPAILRQVYRDSAKLVAAVAFPITALLVIGAPSFIRLMYGERWLSAILPLQVLAVSGLAMSLTMVNASLLVATGRRRRNFPGVLGMLAVVLMFLYPAVQSGIVAVAAVLTAGTVVGLVSGELLAADAVGNSFRQQVTPLLLPGLAATGSAAMAAWLFHGIFGTLNAPLLVLMAGAMAVGYAAVLLVLDRDVMLAFHHVRSWRRIPGWARADRPGERPPSL